MEREKGFRVYVDVEDFRYLRIVPIRDLPHDGAEVYCPVDCRTWKKWTYDKTERVDKSLPFLRMDLGWAKPLYEALRDTFNFGESERVLKAELEATRKHLQDMRRLVLGLDPPTAVIARGREEKSDAGNLDDEQSTAVGGGVDQGVDPDKDT